MSLLARIEAALLDRHQRSTPWPAGHGAVTTKGATMSTIAEGRCPHCGMVRQLNAAGLMPLHGYPTPLDECPGTSKAPLRERLGVTSETEGSARPIPPEALNGLTGAAYTDVIRREADRDYFIASIAARDATIAQMAHEIERHEATIANMQTERDVASAEVRRLQALLDLANREIQRFTRERDEALATIARMRTGRP